MPMELLSVAYAFFVCMKEKIKREFQEFRLLLKSVPSIVIVLFVVSVFSMNLLANKSINLGVDWLALDTGIIVSWFAFLSMDVITKHFGPKAGTQISIMTLVFSLFFCLLFFIGSVIPGVWGESFVEGSEDVINTALNKTFGGTWYVLLGSSVAFLVSSVVNNFSNWGIGKIFVKKPDGILAYITRTYVSTAIGQFVDNFVFALIVSHNFFGWTILQCFTCALTGMVAELLVEVIFFHLGFSITKKWKKQEIGKEYFEFRKRKDSVCEC